MMEESRGPLTQSRSFLQRKSTLTQSDSQSQIVAQNLRMRLLDELAIKITDISSLAHFVQYHIYSIELPTVIILQLRYLHSFF